MSADFGRFRLAFGLRRSCGRQPTLSKVAGDALSNDCQLNPGRSPSMGVRTRKGAWTKVEAKLPGAVEAVDGRLKGLPTARAELQRDSRFRREFVRQKERVAAMDFRVVTITDNFESYVFEPYAALMLATPYNSWATS